MSLGDRVSDRERYLNEAEFYVQSEKTYDKAIEAFNKLLEQYPGDVNGNADLGWVYMRLEQWDKAKERYKVNVQNKVEEVYSYTNLADLYEAKGLYDKAKDVLEYYLNNFSDNYDIHLNLAYNYLSQGKYDLALVEADKAFILDPTHFDNFSTKGEIYLYQGDLMKAEEEFQKLLNSREPLDYSYGLVSLLCLNLLKGKFEKVEILGRQGLEFANKVSEDVWKLQWQLGFAEYYLRSGNPEHALKECDEAWNIAEKADYISGQRRALYNKGLALLEMKSMDEAQRAADDLKEMIERGMNKKLMRFYYNLIGWIELERENFSESIKYFKKAISLLSYGPLTKRADFIDSLALAYYKSGDLEKAQEEYERITYLTTGRFYYGDIYAKSFYMLGKIYEQQGQKVKAIEHYEKFLDLWKDADPGIPEVKDARKKLTGLQELH